jgi:hypothetical protein
MSAGAIGHDGDMKPLGIVEHWGVGPRRGAFQFWEQNCMATRRCTVSWLIAISSIGVWRVRKHWAYQEQREQDRCAQPGSGSTTY